MAENYYALYERTKLVGALKNRVPINRAGLKLLRNRLGKSCLSAIQISQELYVQLKERYIGTELRESNSLDSLELRTY